MFPFEQSGEISFQESEQDLIPQNELLSAINLSNPSTPTSTNPTKGRPRAGGRRSWPADTSAGGAPDLGINQGNHMMKKLVHRDIERQRRQEMSSLFSSLRSLLPPPYVKGKRSTSDHISESINYIKDLEKNIKGLGVQRDKLKRLQDDEYGGGGGNGDGFSSSSNNNGCNIGVYTNSVGLQVEIIISGLNEERFALSNALKVLHDEGLNVVSCVTNRANAALFHNIQCQVNDMRCTDIDIQWLQQRLYEAVC